MSGQRIPLYHKLRNGWQLYREHSTNAWGGAESYVKRFEKLRGLLRQYTGKPISGSRTLEIGCGQRAVMPLILAAKGAESHGIDVEVPTHRMNPAVFVRILRANGWDRALKSAARSVLFDRAFYGELQAVFELDALSRDRPRIRVMDAAELDYPSDHFDLIFSSAVFEHVADVESAVRELNRVLKPDGIASVHAHLFASLSGGHCMDWWQPDKRPSKKVPPWDHLRENKFPVNTYLNKLRASDFKRIFEHHMVIEEETYSREGLGLSDLIPDELLKEYSVEELTTRGLRFVVRKKH